MIRGTQVPPKSVSASQPPSVTVPNGIPKDIPPFLHQLGDPTVVAPFSTKGFYHVPIIVSNGPDKSAGLSPFGEILDSSANDNIYSYDLR